LRSQPAVLSPKAPDRQRGQAMVMVYLFLTVMVVAALILYKTGQLTSNKMQMQNAADATAYSASLTEARDLNFAAYMNRAIVANEVAIGQMVGLASWAFHWRSFADFILTYDKLVLVPATAICGGCSSAVIEPVARIAWQIPGDAFLALMRPFANFGTTVLHNVNKAYGLAQFGYHTVSIVFAIGTLDEMIDQNAPDGTKISDFGILALIAHMASYGGIPGLPGTKFTQSYNPATKVDASTDEGKEEFQQGGYGRLASLIHESGDPFTKARGWELRPPGFPIDLTMGDTWGDCDIGCVIFEIRFHFDLSLERKGASELRIIIPTNKKVSGQSFNWSSADTTGLFFELGGGFDVAVDTLLGEVFSLGADLMVADGKLEIILDLPVVGDTTILDVPFPTAAPFAAGFAQAGKTGNTLNKLKMMISPAGPVDNNGYGEAAQNLLAWEAPGPGPAPLPLGVSSAATIPYPKDHTVNKKYAGLPRYVDTTGADETLFGFGAPNLIIGLVLDDTDFDTGFEGSGAPRGRFALTHGFADDEIAVIAKSTLQFKRPFKAGDPARLYFGRADGAEEYGNAFNPYWTATLVDTSYADRILALLIQQKEDFLLLGRSLDLLFDDIMSYLPG